MPSAPEIDRATRARVLSSLEEVGKTKAVGYLPLQTISNVLRESIDELVARFSRRGLDVKIFGERETCIKSGAMFVYHPGMVKQLVETHKAALLQKHWALAPDEVISEISREWFEPSDPIMPFIRDLYNDRP
jgi:hypothetical protein